MSRGFSLTGRGLGPAPPAREVAMTYLRIPERVRARMKAAAAEAKPPGGEALKHQNYTLFQGVPAAMQDRLRTVDRGADRSPGTRRELDEAAMFLIGVLEHAASEKRICVRICRNQVTKRLGLIVCLT